MFFAQRDSFTMVKWSPSRTILGAVGNNGALSLYDVSHSIRLPWHIPLGDTRYAALLCLAWSPALAGRQREWVALGGYAGIVEVWDVQARRKLCTYTGHSPEVAELPAKLPPNRRAILALAWSDDGALLASAGDDLRVHIWHPESGECWTVVDQEPLRAGGFLAWLDPRTLLSSSTNCVYIWDVLTGKVLREIRTPLSWEKPNSYALSPDRSQLAIADASSILFYNLQTGEQGGYYSPTDQLRPVPYRDMPSLVAWNPDGRRLAACFKDAPDRLFLWNVREQQTLLTHQHFADITCLDWSADGEMLAWAGSGYVATAAFAHSDSPPPIVVHASSDHAPALTGTSHRAG